MILFDKVQVPHYNYVGDSILGYKAHMGAGSITSNVKSDKLLVSIHAADGEIESGRKKVGALIGDNVEVGCGSVLNPGTVIGRNSNIYPLSSVRGCVGRQFHLQKAGRDSREKINYAGEDAAGTAGPIITPDMVRSGRASILNYPHVFLKGMIIPSNYAMIKSERINSACIVIQ